ncbi:RAD50-interacting protein 1-like isoform X2 [Mercenaria mercenaria]|uniref:RAD50-interacting protein 1-like isoform X2 n=1 Tax=Mercenaria mercenaria TaxID=6596 RepID=UPI00234E59EE|nr:RAD50-interacting protein 1-like isoform X2 [Mercenaria mercenaria]
MKLRKSPKTVGQFVSEIEQEHLLIAAYFNQTIFANMAAPMGKSDSDKFAIEFVNAKLGDDIKSLKSVRDLYREYRDKQKSLESQLSLASSEVPNEIEKAIRDAEKAGKDVKRLGAKKEELYHEIQDRGRDISSLVKETSKLTIELSELEHLSKYLSCLVQIDTLSSKIEMLLQSERLAECVEKFTELSSLYITLEPSCCHNMVKYAKDTTLYWYKILKNKIASEFEEVLKLLRWPLVAMTIKAPPVQNPAEVKSKMEQLFKQLLKLQLPDSVTAEVEQLHPQLAQFSGIRHPILPLQLMIKPLRRRFKYHFYGNKQTNDIGKPEWYFTQILSWIRDHLDFLDQRIQPLLREAGKQTVDSKLEFMIGMVTMVMEKMLTDLPELMNDDHQFCHLVDEALLFDREIRSSYRYPATYPGSLHVLSLDKYFKKWLQIEKKFAIEKLDGMMSSPTAWDSQYRHIADVDELKVPECGESFMTLMLTITDRYKPLPHSSQKLCFLDLQLELLEDFRVRIIQVKDNTHNPLSDCFCSILNTAYYVTEVLREWSELVFFLQLQFYRMECNEHTSSESAESSDIPFGYTTVFEDMIALYDRLRQDMLKAIVNHVFTDVRARSKPYRDDRWISLPYQKEVNLGLSTSACEMLLVLKDHLLEVGELISKPLFNLFWEKMAQELNTFIYEEVILRNRFNHGGAAQLQFDMTRNLFPLFGEYTPKPDSYFKEVKEASTILNLNVGSAILLKEVLNSALHVPKKDVEKLTEARSALNDVGVYKLTLDQAELVLSLRTNLTT